MSVVGDFLQLVARETTDRPPEPLTALQWLQDRYAAVLERAPWSFMVREATFQTVAEITAGTVTVTANSANVDETTLNANGWTSAVEGRYFRKDSDSEYYLIDTFTDAVDRVVLNRVYEGSSGTTQGYTIFQRLFSLAADVREVLDVYALRSPRVLREVPQAELDAVVPNRPELGYPPRYWAYAGRDTSNNMRLELYPIPDEARGIGYRYIQETPSLADADVTLLPQVNIGLLKSGWLADYWGWRMNQEDAPADALVKAQANEQMFEKRLQEMVIREMSNQTPQWLKPLQRFIRHRGRMKWGRDVTLLTSDES